MSLYAAWFTFEVPDGDESNPIPVGLFMSHALAIEAHRVASLQVCCYPEVRTENYRRITFRDTPTMVAETKAHGGCVYRFYIGNVSVS